MRVYNRKTSVGLAWTRKGSCFGVRLRRFGSGVRIEHLWSAAAEGDVPLAAVLAAGAVETGAEDAAAIIAGPAEPTALAADLDMPPLSPDDLRRALEFELASRVPVSPAVSPAPEPIRFP